MTPNAVRFTRGLMLPVRDLVINIGAMRIPAEVFNPIVELVAIVVTRLHAIGAWTHECLKHKPVNESRILLSAKRQRYS